MTPLSPEPTLIPEWVPYTQAEMLAAADRCDAGRMSVMLRSIAHCFRAAPACPDCNGSGAVGRMTWGHGPDDYEEFVSCPSCDGTGATHPQSAPQAEPFCWLVELWKTGGNSEGKYHTGLTDLGGNSRTTTNPHAARKYDKTGAERVANQLNALRMSAFFEWRAIEHGFDVGTAMSLPPPKPVPDENETAFPTTGEQT